MESYYPEQTNLTKAELQMVDEFSKKIDLRDSSVVLRYGAACQKKVAAFSDNALEDVRTKDLGAAGKLLTDLTEEMKRFPIEPEERGFLGSFKKAGRQNEKLKERYKEATASMEEISGKLEMYQNQLLKDSVRLDKLYEANLAHCKELSMYILAGQKKLELERDTTLMRLKETAQVSGQTHDIQAANDFAANCDCFEKKLHDLKLTRAVTMQMAPQIRLIQHNQVLISEKIQSALTNTIPLWKKMMEQR